MYRGAGESERRRMPLEGRVVSPKAGFSLCTVWLAKANAAARTTMQQATSLCAYRVVDSTVRIWEAVRRERDTHVAIHVV
jgi:hypothetical protein